MAEFSRDWLLRAKLVPPPVGTRVVPRERIASRLAAATALQIVCLVAPAGFGKTTALSQLYRRLEGQGRRLAWVSLDTDDADPAQFIAYLSAALAGAGVAVATGVDGRWQGSREDLFAYAVRELLHRLEVDSHPLTLMIDDVHMLEGASMTLLAQLVQNLPSQVSLVMGSRRRPPVRLQNLLLHERLAELDYRELAFTEDETCRLLGDVCAPSVARAMQHHTEGWAAALELARGWLTHHTVDATQATNLGNHSVDVLHYLAEEVMQALPAHTRDFLLRTSVSRRLCADLANALCERDDAGALLEELELQNQLVIAEDSDRTWYRYHAVLRDFLELRRRRTWPSLEHELHRRAALWFAEKGLFAEAIYHAQHCGHEGFGLQLVENAGGWRLALSGGLPVLRVLRDLMPDPREDYPRVALAQVYLMAQEGAIHSARAAFDSLARLTAGFTEVRGKQLSACLRPESSAVDFVLHIYEDTPLSPSAIESLEAAIVDLPDLAEEVRAIIHNFRCFAYFDHGDYRRACEIGRAAWAKSRRAHAYYAENYVYAYVALGHLHLGEMDAADEALAQMEQRASTQFGSDSNQTATAHLLMAALAYERDEQSAAAVLLEDAMPRVEAVDGWCDIYAAGFETQVRLAAAQGRLLGADDALLRWEARGRRLALPRLSLLCELERLNQHLRSGKLAEARALWASVSEKWAACGPVVKTRTAALYQLTSLRLACVAGDGEETIGKALNFIEFCSTYGLTRMRVAALLVLGVARRRSAKPGWDDAMVEALEVAAAAGLVRSVLDEGQFVVQAARALMQRPSNVLSNAALGLLAMLAANSTESLQVGATDVAAEHLTPREQEVMRALVDGLSNKEIARALAISAGTVKIHRRNLYRKLGVNSRAGLVKASRALP